MRATGRGRGCGGRCTPPPPPPPPGPRPPWSPGSGWSSASDRRRSRVWRGQQQQPARSWPSWGLRQGLQDIICRLHIFCKFIFNYDHDSKVMLKLCNIFSYFSLYILLYNNLDIPNFITTYPVSSWSWMQCCCPSAGPPGTRHCRCPRPGSSWRSPRTWGHGGISILDIVVMVLIRAVNASRRLKQAEGEVLWPTWRGCPSSGCGSPCGGCISRAGGRRSPGPPPGSRISPRTGRCPPHTPSWRRSSAGRRTAAGTPPRPRPRHQDHPPPGGCSASRCSGKGSEAAASSLPSTGPPAPCPRCRGRFWGCPPARTRCNIIVMRVPRSARPGLAT